MGGGGVGAILVISLLPYMISPDELYLFETRDLSYFFVPTDNKEGTISSNTLID